MKRYICAALAAALLAPALWAVAARADDDDSGQQAVENHEGGKADHGAMAERAKQRLGLSDDQAAKLKDAMKAHHDAMKPLWDKLKGDMKKLHEQVNSKASDSDVQASLDSLKADHKAVADEEGKLQDSLSFLTPTQRAKLLFGAMHMRRERMMGGKGRRGPKDGDEEKKGDDDKDGD